MTAREIIDRLALAAAKKVLRRAHGIKCTAGRLDLPYGVDRLFFYPGHGHLLGLPTRPGTSSTDVTGVPTNGIGGFAKSAIFYNFKGSIGTLVYANTGTETSATWTNIL